MEGLAPPENLQAPVWKEFVLMSEREPRLYKRLTEWGETRERLKSSNTFADLASGTGH